MTPQQQFELIHTFWENLKGPFFRHVYQIGPFAVALIFADRLLEQKIVKAFNHLEIKKESVDLTIGLWDCATIDQRLPDLEWELFYRHTGYCDSSTYLYYDGMLYAMHQDRAYFAVRDAKKLPWWISGSPLQIILNLWLRKQGMQLTHTAAISNGKKALLFCGKGGSGKSTTTLACVKKGLRYIGEDYCILAPGNPPFVFSIYQSAKWEKNTRRLFPNYEQFIANPNEADKEKALVYYQDFFPEQIQISSPIEAIVSLQLGKEQLPTLEKTDEHTILPRLMMSTVAQLPIYEHRTVLILETLVKQIPSYHLILGRDIHANCQIIQNLLESTPNMTQKQNSEALAQPK